MRRKSPMLWTVLFLALLLVMAAAAGCGGSSSSSSGASSSSAATASLTADQIVQQSAEKMKDVKSATVTANVALAVQGDSSKMTDPTQKALLSQGVSLHVDGKSQTSPMAADMKLSVGLAGQNIDLGIIAYGDKAGSSTRASTTRSTRRTPRVSPRSREWPFADGSAQEGGAEHRQVGHQVRTRGHGGHGRHAGLPREGHGRHQGDGR